MGLRETLNENPRLTTGITVGLIVLAIGLTFLLNRSGSSVASPVKGHYYTDDDGATWFVDELYKPTPFDHNGKQAVRARVFKCGEKGKPFVAYLEKLTPKGKKELEQYQSEPNNKGRMAVMINREIKYWMVKKPADAKWVDGSRNPDEVVQIRSIHCPDGGDNSMIEEVLPE